jgi:hypothetical protein
MDIEAVQQDPSRIQAGGFAAALSAPGQNGVARVTRATVTLWLQVHRWTETPAGVRTGRRIDFSSTCVSVFFSSRTSVDQGGRCR